VSQKKEQQEKDEKTGTNPLGSTRKAAREERG
jgi:hypothetical protein